MRKLRRLAGAETSSRFLMDYRRDPEPRLLDEVALDLVAQLGHPFWSGTRFDGDPADLADAVCRGEGETVQRKLIVDQQPGEPHTAELRALLLQGHARHECIDVCHRAPSALGVPSQ